MEKKLQSNTGEKNIVNNSKENKPGVENKNESNNGQNSTNPPKPNEPHEKKKRKAFPKERYFMNVIQSYIVRNDFSKIISLSLQYDGSDFDEKDKNEKFLKLLRDRFGLEKYLCMVIKAQQELQRLYLEKKMHKKKGKKFGKSFFASLDPNSSTDVNTVEGFNNAILNNGMIPNVVDGNPDNPDDKNEVTYEDLNREINDILFGNLKKNLTGNNSMAKPVGAETKKPNDISTDNKDQGDYNSIFEKIIDTTDTKAKVNDNSSLFASIPTSNPNTKALSLGLSVHLHKDDANNIYKYYLHHYMNDTVAAYYCSDKKCSGSAKYMVETKKFEIISDHSLPYASHSYISKPFPNDIKLFKEFEIRNYKEAQLFKQSNGKSNISWYN